MAKTISKVSYSVAIGNSFRTIEDGCKAFGLKPIKYGYRYKAGASFKNATVKDKALHDVALWFPNAQSNEWNNNSGLGVIIESPKKTSKTKAHVNKFLNTYELRITFLKHGGDYTYVGVYELDKQETNKMGVCVWKCVIDAFSSDLHEIKDYLNNRQ